MPTKVTRADIIAAKQRRVARALAPFNAIGRMFDRTLERDIPILTDAVDYLTIENGRLVGHVVTDPAVRAMADEAKRRMT